MHGCVGGWVLLLLLLVVVVVMVGGGGGLSKKPIVLDSTFIPTDARFPFILSV